MPELNGKVLFIHVPRTGGTSIEHMFRVTGLIGVKDFGVGRFATQALTPEEIIKFKLLTKEKMLSMFKFCFVRNPWDKLVSDYIPRSKYKHAGKEISLSFRDYLNKAKAVMDRFKAKEENCIVSNFGPENAQDNHIRQQVDFIHYEEKNIMDFIGRFENYEEDFNKVCDFSGLGKVEEVLHTRKSERKHYSEYYNEQTKNIVSEMFAEDIEYFGYEFEEE